MNEQELIQKIKNWESQYLETLLENHLQKIYQACYRVCLDETNANDVTQNVVIKIIKNIWNFKQESNFSTWYYRIAYNESINFLNKQKTSIQIDEIENKIIDEDTDFYSLDKKEIKQDINQLINSLPVIDRNIILYFYFDELKIREISEIMNMNENSIKTKLSRIKKHLQPLLEKYENNY